MLILGAIDAPLTSAQDGAPEAAAPDDETDARTRFRVGRALVDAGLFREAHEEFRRGFVLSRRSAFVFNMAECSRALEDAAARGEYAAYLELDPTGPFVGIAQERLDELGPGNLDRPSFLVDLDRADLQLSEPDSVVFADPLHPVSERRRWYADWPFWTAVGVVVVSVAVTAGVLASRDDELVCGAGCELVRW